MKLIAAIEEPAAIQRILTHLGLATQPPPRIPARRSTIVRANARMACKSGAWGLNIVSDVEKTAGVQCMSTR